MERKIRYVEFRTSYREAWLNAQQYDHFSSSVLKASTRRGGVEFRSFYDPDTRERVLRIEGDAECVGLIVSELKVLWPKYISNKDTLW